MSIYASAAASKTNPIKANSNPIKPNFNPNMPKTNPIKPNFKPYCPGGNYIPNERIAAEHPPQTTKTPQPKISYVISTAKDPLSNEIQTHNSEVDKYMSAPKPISSKHHQVISICSTAFIEITTPAPGIFLFNNVYF